MCMKYVNATTRCYKMITRDGHGNYLSFYAPFDTLPCVKKEGHIVIQSFFIQTEVTIMGTSNKDRESENPISRGDNLHFTLRLTKCDKELRNRLGIDLDSFDINLADLQANNKILHACYPFYTTMRITTVNDVELPTVDSGKYVLKVLVRATDNPKDDTIQSMSTFTVSCGEAY